MEAASDGDSPTAWLARHETTGATTADALAFFDSLPPVALAEMTGRWRGFGLPTGHPLDGLLEDYGWWGKEFIDAETVHPLLFAGEGGAVVAVSSQHLPMAALSRLRLPGAAPKRAAAALLRAAFGAKKPTARLRMLEHRGRVSAAMIYDFLPIIDSFRRVDADTLLGVMDWRAAPQPFFFVLRRA